MPTRSTRLLALAVLLAAGVLSWRVLDAERGTAPTQKAGQSDRTHPAPDLRPRDSHFAAAEASPFRQADSPSPSGPPSSPTEWETHFHHLANAPQGALFDDSLSIFARHAGKEQVTALSVLYKDSKDPVLRQRIIDVLSALSSNEGLDGVGRLLDDPDLGPEHPLVLASSEALARRGSQKDVMAILKRLDDLENPDAAKGLQDSLARVSHPALEMLLCDAAAGRGASRSPAARAAAAAALANYPSVAVTETLHAITREDSEESVRNQAERSLTIIRTPE